MDCLSGHKWNGTVCSICNYSVELNSDTDLGILLDIAVCGGPSQDMRDVMQLINDQDSIEFVANNTKNPMALKLAIEKLENQELLENFAKQGYRIAMEKLTDQHVLANIAKELKMEGYVRRMAVNSLTDRSILDEISNTNDERKYTYKEEEHSYGFEGSDGAQYAVNYTETVTVDLRIVAKERLAEL